MTLAILAAHGSGIMTACAAAAAGMERWKTFTFFCVLAAGEGYYALHLAGVAP